MEADSKINVTKEVEEAMDSAKNPKDLSEAKKDAQNLADLKSELFDSEVKIRNLNSDINADSKEKIVRPYKAIQSETKEAKESSNIGLNTSQPKPEFEDKSPQKEIAETETRPDQIKEVADLEGKDKANNKNEKAPQESEQKFKEMTSDKTVLEESKAIAEQKIEVLEQKNENKIADAKAEKGDVTKKEEAVQPEVEAGSSSISTSKEVEGIAKAEKEAEEKEVREQLLNDMIGKMMEIQKIEKEIAAQEKTALEESKAMTEQKIEVPDLEDKYKALEESRQQLQEMILGKPTLEASEAINNEVKSKAEKIEQKIEDLAQKHENEIADAKAEKGDVTLQEVLKNVKVETDEFIATAMKIEFGASISDILMKSPDVGLHAGNVLLGSPDKDGKIDKSAQINSTKTLLNMAEGKLKIQTIDKKMKEFELSQLEKLKAAGGKVDDKAINKLKEEVHNLEEQVAHSQANVGRVEADIIDLQKN